MSMCEVVSHPSPAPAVVAAQNTIMLATNAGGVFVFVAIDRDKVSDDRHMVSLPKFGDFCSRRYYFGSIIRSSDASFHGLDWEFPIQDCELSPVD
ncbi:unnamed protein product [Alternaria alternata]